MTRFLAWFLAIGIMIGFFSGCNGPTGSGQPSDSIGLTGPVLSGTVPSLQIVTQARSIGTGESMPVVFTAFDEFGRPCPDGTKIIASFDLGGKVDPVELGTTKGFAQAVYTAGADSGVETISAAALGVTGSATVTILANPPARAIVRVAPVVDQAHTGETLPVVVFVTNSSGNSVVAKVTMYSSMGGTFDPKEGDSEKGLFLTSYTASTSQGIDVITAIAGGTTATASLAVLP